MLAPWYYAQNYASIICLTLRPLPQATLKHIQNHVNRPHGFKAIGIAHECLISRCFIAKSGV